MRPSPAQALKITRRDARDAPTVRCRIVPSADRAPPERSCSSPPASPTSPPRSGCSRAIARGVVADIQKAVAEGRIGFDESRRCRRLRSLIARQLAGSRASGRAPPDRCRMVVHVGNSPASAITDFGRYTAWRRLSIISEATARLPISRTSSGVPPAPAERPASWMTVRSAVLTIMKCVVMGNPVVPAAAGVRESAARRSSSRYSWARLVEKKPTRGR